MTPVWALMEVLTKLRRRYWVSIVLIPANSVTPEIGLLLALQLGIPNLTVTWLLLLLWKMNPSAMKLPRKRSFLELMIKLMVRVVQVASSLKNRAIWAEFELFPLLALTLKS